jgi:long-subunit fatty acid transport protein
MVVLWSVARASAGGLEYAGQGARALGRGGAMAARADDPMVLAHNPAGLAELRGTQLLFDLNLALMDACVDPSGYYGYGAYGGGQPSQLPDPDSGEPAPLPLGPDTSVPGMTQPAAPAAKAYYYDPYDTVCLDQQITPIPQLAWTTRVTEDLGIGFGLIFPAVTPGGRWGSPYGVIRNEQGELRPAATRYMLLNSSNLGIFPTLGVGYRVFDALRIGLAVEWGVFAINNYTMAAAGGGTSPHNDVLAHTKAQDWFVPAATASVHVVPVDSIDVVLAFRYQDAIDATGTQDLTTGVFDPRFEAYETKGIEITSLRIDLPWKLRAGVRYADRLIPRPSGTGSHEADFTSGDVIHDPLQDERFDIELDVEYQINSRFDKQVIEYAEGGRLNFRAKGSDQTMSIVFPAPQLPSTVIEKNWKDQLSVRMGGTYNVLPGMLGLSAGAHYETRGVDPSYAQIDFFPFQRVGLHAGVIVRVMSSLDLVFSYAHIFQEELVVELPEHREHHQIDDLYAMGDRTPYVSKRVDAPLDRGGVNGTMVIEEPSQGPSDGVAKVNQILARTGADQPPWIVNAGRYRSSIDVLAVGINVHF